MLNIKNFKIEVAGKVVVSDISMKIKAGETHVLMGPNGSGKSSLAYSLAGHPFYNVLAGTAELDKQNLLELTPDQRVKNGLFLAFQNPVSVEGVNVYTFLKLIYQANFPKKRLLPYQFKKKLKDYLQKLQMHESFLDRYLNEGFSGGEKKRMEILQLLVLEPKYAIFDEIDSGLDVDALKIVAQNISLVAKQQKIGILIITHYQRILKYFKPDHVHIMHHGKIVKSGGIELVSQIESEGYKNL